MIDDALMVMIVGMSVVFTSLAFFYVVIVLINKLNNYYNNFRVNKKLLEFTEPSESTAPISDELVAVISAAVFETLNKKVRIKKIQYLDANSYSTSWLSSGRASLLSSHNIHKGKRN